MIEKNIQFTVKDEYGHDINCFVLAYKNVNSEEINILFNQDGDNDDVIRYGKVFKNTNGYTLSNKISEEELEELKELLSEEIKDISFKIVSTGQEPLV